MSTKRVFLTLRSSPKKDEITIREAIQEDVPQIISSSKTADRFRMSRYIDELDEEEIRFWVSDRRTIIIVAMLKSKLLGYAYGFCLSPKWFFFDSFLVIPKFRRKGIGKIMYGYLRGICKRRGFQLIQGLVKDGYPGTLKYWTNLDFENGSKCIWVEDWLDGD